MVFYGGIFVYGRRVSMEDGVKGCSNEVKELHGENMVVWDDGRMKKSLWCFWVCMRGG